MTFKLALKNCIDSISQTSKMIFLDPFRAYVHLFKGNLSMFSLWTISTELSATCDSKNPISSNQRQNKHTYAITQTLKTLLLEQILHETHPSQSSSFRSY